MKFKKNMEMRTLYSSHTHIKLINILTRLIGDKLLGKLNNKTLMINLLVDAVAIKY